MKKLLLTLLALMLCILPAIAEETAPERLTDGQFVYCLTDEGAVLDQWAHWLCEAIPEVVEIPAVLGGMPVVGVADNALNTFEMTGDSTFTLVIPEGVKWLADDALQCCHHADTVVLPASLTRIPEGLSNHVWAEIVLAQGNPRYSLTDGFLIDTQESVLIYAAPSSHAYSLPSVRRIGCGSLQNWACGTPWGELEVVIPEGVEEIGAYAFYDWALKSVTLPESLRSIESYAFASSFEDGQVITIPAGVETVCYNAFDDYGISLKLLGDTTHVETEDEYAARTEEDWEPEAE